MWFYFNVCAASSKQVRGNDKATTITYNFILCFIYISMLNSTQVGFSFHFLFGGNLGYRHRSQIWFYFNVCAASSKQVRGDDEAITISYNFSLCFIYISILNSTQVGFSFHFLFGGNLGLLP